MSLLTASRSKMRWGVALAFLIGILIWVVTLNVGMALSATLITVTGLGLNLDNVVLIGPLVRNLSPWGRRLFFTIGMIISVLGVQLFVPVLIVSAVNGVGLSDSIHMAVFHSREYGHLQEQASPYIDAGATAFLSLMSLTYMFDPNKKLHWWRWGEDKMAKLGEHDFIALAIVGSALFILAMLAPSDNQKLLISVCFGSYVAFMFFHIAGKIIETKSAESSQSETRWYRTAMQLIFIMVLESLFSIDSLASAFAITSAILPIVVGLVASGLFMRALLFDVSENDRISQYKYLETAAYWAVLYLAIVTYLSVFGVHLPDIIVGSGGTAIIAFGALHSHLENKRADKQLAAAPVTA